MTGNKYEKGKLLNGCGAGTWCMFKMSENSLLKMRYTYDMKDGCNCKFISPVLNE